MSGEITVLEIDLDVDCTIETSEVTVINFAVASAQELNNTTTVKPVKKVPKRSYVCPPHFIRLSHRCYYFSNEAATWQDAYFQCRDLHSNLAIIRSANQDKLIRRTLNKKSSGLSGTRVNHLSLNQISCSTCGKMARWSLRLGADDLEVGGVRKTFSLPRLLSDGA
jgi:hypothetical protein